MASGSKLTSIGLGLWSSQRPQQHCVYVCIINIGTLGDRAIKVIDFSA